MDADFVRSHARAHRRGGDMSDIDKYYKILGIDYGASDEDIKQAYRDMAKIWHPDRFSRDPRLQKKAADKLQEINDAFQKVRDHRLSSGNFADAQKRRERSRPNPANTPPAKSPPRPPAGSPRAQAAKQPHKPRMFHPTAANKRILGMILLDVIVIVIIVLLASQLAPMFRGDRRPAPDGEAESTWVEKANVAFKSGDFKAAINAYTFAIYNDLRNVRLYVLRGYSYSESGMHREAIADCNHAIELQPDNPANYLARGKCFHKMGNLGRALEDYSLAIKMNPDDPRFRSIRGGLLFERDRYREAIADYTKAIELDPNTIGYYFSRGNCYDSLGDYPRAVEDFTRTIDLDATRADAYYARGLSYTSLQDFKRAREDMIVAARLGDEPAQTHLSVDGIEW